LRFAARESHSKPIGPQPEGTLFRITLQATVAKDI
jgi:hypothetical protein